MERGATPVHPLSYGTGASDAWRPVVIWTALAGIGLGAAKIAEWSAWASLGTLHASDFLKSWSNGGILLFVIADVGAAGTLVAASIGCLCRRLLGRKLFLRSASVISLLILVDAVGVALVQKKLSTIGIVSGLSWIYLRHAVPVILQRMLLPTFLWLLMSRPQSYAAFARQSGLPTHSSGI